MGVMGVMWVCVATRTNNCLQHTRHERSQPAMARACIAQLTVTVWMPPRVRAVQT